MNKTLKEFPVSIYGSFEKYNDVLSKARCRIFYKYENRNGTYITDEFADELISTLPYSPVKGIYENSDYTDHGEERDEGRIYGIVPETTNFAWEKHVDEDGIEREYACADVLIFTALYGEASEIVGKAQSMELYEPSLKYHWSVIKGQKYVVFDHGCFLGLQVLGDDVEPCFEGASFYTLQKSIKDIIQQIKDYSKGGQSEMHNLKFKLSDDQKFDALWSLLNTEYCEEGDWTISYGICQVFDEYALCINYETGHYERVYYTKNDELDSVELGEKIAVHVVDITDSEKNTLDTLRQLNGDTYELVSENLVNAEKNATACAEFDTKIEEFNNTISTLQQEASEMQEKLDGATAQYDQAQNQLSELTTEVESLRNYKHDIELKEKENVFAEYTDKLSEEVINTYKEKIEDYTVVDLDKELAYECKKAGASVFSIQTPGYVPKDQTPSGIEAILSRYKK